MKVKFKAVRELDGVRYGKGTHEVPDALADHWYFKAMLVNGIVSVLVAPKGSKVLVDQKPEQPPAPPVENPPESYRQHMAKWESEEEKAGKVETATQEEAQKMIDSGEAQIPPEAVTEEQPKQPIKKGAGKKGAQKK